MVCVVDEHLGVGVRLEDWLSTSGHGISLKDSKEIVGVDFRARVGDVILEVDVFSVWLVED